MVGGEDECMVERDKEQCMVRREDEGCMVRGRGRGVYGAVLSESKLTESKAI